MLCATVFRAQFMIMKYQKLSPLPFLLLKRITPHFLAPLCFIAQRRVWGEGGDGGGWGGADLENLPPVSFFASNFFNTLVEAPRAFSNLSGSGSLDHFPAFLFLFYFFVNIFNLISFNFFLILLQTWLSLSIPFTCCAGAGEKRDRGEQCVIGH